MSYVLSADRWKTLEPIFDAAVELPLERRSAFMREACAGDDGLLAELELLLREYDQRDALFDRPAAEQFASLIDDELTRLPAVLNGRYRIERELGRGGMAVVYLAHDIRHDRRVAVKVHHPEFAAALGAQRFLAEIQVTAQLQHPHVLPLHDSGEADGFLFYVMPYVEGGSLRKRLDIEQQLPIVEAVRITCEVASALNAAHRRGVIHRDIKPENILFHDGRAMLADFGIALAISEATPRVTRPGLTLGTPQYMSPEQATGGGTIDSRADVYALGAVLYEMLAGEGPFISASPAGVIAKRAATPPPSVRILRPATLESTDAVVARALARQPVDRYQTAGDFAAALQQSLTKQTATRRRRTTALVGVVAFASIALIGARTIWRRDALPPLDPNKIAVVPFGVTSADSSATYLAEGVAVLLAPMLTGEGGPLGVDSRTAISMWHRVSRGRENGIEVAREVARRVGAGKALAGNLVYAAGRVTLTASFVDAARGDARPLTSVTGAIDSLPSLLDSVLRQLLVRHAGVPERSIGELTSQSLPALRAYLDGRAAYRRSHTAEAIRGFTRAIETDSTFALAALDLATASNKLLRQIVCPPPDNACVYVATMPALQDAGLMSDNKSFDRGIALASAYRAKLGLRDQLMLDALRGRHYPQPSLANETLEDFERAVAAAPDRAETQYILGLIMLYEGRSVGYSDAMVRAEASFQRAQMLDRAYLAPLASLVDVAGYQGDQEKLRRTGAQYLALDSAGATADYVRWRVAVGTNDEAMRRTIRARFDSLDVTTLNQIATASQMTGLALEDADRAAALAIARATVPGERGGALYRASVVALNRGRPRQADSLLRLRREGDTAKTSFWRSSMLAAQFGDGDSADAEATARARGQWLAKDTIGKTIRSPIESTEAYQQALWAWAHNRMQDAETLTNWLRRQDAYRKFPATKRSVDVSEMLIATSRQRSDAAVLRARVDSESLGGCCLAPHTLNLSLAEAYELAGDSAAALRTLRRGKSSPGFLSTYLLKEGRLAAKLGDRDGAIRAYEHYLALRSDPEPSLRPQRDSVRAEVDRLKRRR